MLMGGDCYNYALLASGHIDIVCEAGLKLHDFAALAPIVEGAGGTMCDWRGEPLHAASDGRVLALGDAARLDGVLAALESGAAHRH
jgi:fructose-1,6-bisphosphatase/inositol monophosphatase family enzyme